MLLSTTSRAAKLAVRQAPALAPLTRTFADAAHAPPIALFGLEAKYANALYTSASKDGSLAKVEKDLTAIAKNIGSVPNFAEFLENPTISRANKKGDIEAIMKAGKFSPVTSSFFSVLAENGRLGASSKIIDSFSQLMMANRGEVSAKIISAEPLSSAQLKTLTGSLDAYADGKTLMLETEVDPEILGGLKVQIGDRFIDLSIGSKISKMNRLLMESV